MGKEPKKEIDEALGELMNVANRLTCISALVNPKDSDGELALDFPQAIGFAELLQDCANKICVVMAKIEPYKEVQS